MPDVVLWILVAVELAAVAAVVATVRARRRP